MLLSAFVGTGTQIVAVLFIGVLFALAGFLSPANRGGLVTAIVLLFVFLGSLNGYVSARIYKMLGGKLWRRNTAFTAIGFPALIASTAFFINLFVWAEHSTRAIPITTMLALVCLWVGISVPLVCIGAYFGYKRDKIENPNDVNDLERDIPPQVCFPLCFCFSFCLHSCGFSSADLYFDVTCMYENKKKKCRRGTCTQAS